jgi:hypothetical protein
MTAFPQYAKTTDPSVFDALRENEALNKDFFERGMAFAEANGGSAFYSSRWGKTTDLTAIESDKKPTTGRWTEHPRGGWRPFKNNPLYAQMQAIKLHRNAVPGLPEYVESAYNSQMQHYISAPRPFVVDGVVYVGFTFIPQDRNSKSDPEPSEGGWEEIRASEFHAAMETYNDRIKEQKGESE